MTCRGICKRDTFRQKYAPELIPGSTKKYVNGNKRCQKCGIWVNNMGTYCMCCGNRLRTKKRNKYVLNKKQKKLSGIEVCVR